MLAWKLSHRVNLSDKRGLFRVGRDEELGIGLCPIRVGTRHEERGEQAAAEESLVPQRPEVTNRMRGQDQSVEATSRTEPSRYKGPAGMKRWVGLGVIAANLINIAHAMASPATR